MTGKHKITAFALSMLLLSISFNLNAAAKQQVQAPVKANVTNAAPPSFPPNLSDVNENSIPLNTTTSNIKTPEYAIIRAGDETTFSSETTGTVNYLPVKDGSRFKAGDILLRMDCRLQQADLDKAAAQQMTTNKALVAAKKLKHFGMLSDYEYVKADAESRAANADVAKLKATVEKCTVKAPFAGGVVEVKTHLYETVKPGDPLLKVTNTNDLTVEVQVPSQWLSWLRIGTPFNLYVNDIEQTLAAKVTLINPEVEPISQTVKISGQFIQANDTLKPGMTGQADFPDNPYKE
jgi:RND family efflux transporter MFP subunit